jgi:hypothetical protein
MPFGFYANLDQYIDFSASCWFAADVSDQQGGETAPCSVPIRKILV